MDMRQNYSMGTMIGIGLQYALHVRSLSDTEKIAVSLIGSALIVIVVSFVWHFFLVPPDLHPEPKRRAPPDEHHFQIANAVLTKLGPQAGELLRHLKLTGQLIFEPGVNPSLPVGVTQADAIRMLQDLKDEGIVREQKITLPLSPQTDVLRTALQGAITSRSVWEVSPGLIPILDDLLYPDEQKQ